MTKKLYATDSYVTEFNANLLETTQLKDGTWGLILDQTAFYPEGGGQPFDLGTLNDIPVIAVQLNEANQIIHITKELPQGTTLQGRIDWARRFDHMQQHSGEHILTDAFYQVLGAHNVGFHLGVESVQIDLDVESISPEQVAEVENYANQTIFQNRKVSIHFPTSSELNGFPLRKAPPVTEGIRVVWIEASDCCPCGGTHVSQTGEVGLIKIRSWERKKQGIRIDFVCGLRALKDYQAKNSTVNQLSTLLSTPPSEVAAAASHRLERHEVLTKELSILRRELLQYLAQSLVKDVPLIQGHSLITFITSDSNLNLGDLAKELSKLLEEKGVFLLGQINEEASRCNLHFSSSGDTPLKMNQILQSVLPIVNGRGGGSASSAQGGGSKPNQVISALEEAKSLVLQALSSTETLETVL